MALYYVGADKEVLQAEIISAGAVPGAVKLCSSSHPEVQAEAADLLKVMNQHKDCVLPTQWVLVFVQHSGCLCLSDTKCLVSNTLQCSRQYDMCYAVSANKTLQASCQVVSCWAAVILMPLQVLARSPKAAAVIVQDGALPALAMVAGEGLSERAQVNATKVSNSHLRLVYFKPADLYHGHISQYHAYISAVLKIH